MFETHYSLAIANAVLAAVQANHRPEQFDDDSLFVVEAYSNGREQGYHISDRKLVAVSFSGDRNSNKIVIYTGYPLDFSPQGNVPSDIIMLANRAVYVPPSHFGKASEIILEMLKLKGKWEPAKG